MNKPPICLIFFTITFTMVQSKCNGCNQYFKGTHGLSNHFQFNRECKGIHLNLIHQYQVNTDTMTQVDNNNKKITVTQSQNFKSKQCEIDPESKEICQNNDNSN